MRVSTIGAGYVGLVTAACLAEIGHTVTCVDKVPDRIDGLNAGRIPIYEPGLDGLVADGVEAGRLFFTTDLRTALTDCDVVMIAVGTPPRAQDGVADLRFVMQAAEEIAQTATRPMVVVTKSTVPVGTGDRIARLLHELHGRTDLNVVSNPEFLREGNAVADFRDPDRIVVGTDSSHALSVMRSLYAPLIERDVPFVVTSRRSSELIKYASNAFLAMKVSFINEIADMCEGAGADVSDVALAMGLDERIGPRFLEAGPGFGGSCFPKDIYALIKSANDAGTSMGLVEKTISVNETRKRRMARKIEAALGGDVYGKTIAVLGLTFKPGTDDVRDSPAIGIVRALQDRGAHVCAYDPKAGTEAMGSFPGVRLAGSALEAARGADAVVLMTQWPELVELDPEALAGVMQSLIAVDLRNCWDGRRFARHGFAITAIGKPQIGPGSVNGRAWDAPNPNPTSATDDDRPIS